VSRGVADPTRIGVGGHSYGAFMAANLLAHCGDLFACGIARSGAYNRSARVASKSMIALVLAVRTSVVRTDGCNALMPASSRPSLLRC